MKNNLSIQENLEYQWSQSWYNTIAHTDVNKVVQELKEIQEIRGEINPSYVVESAKNKKSALHNYFQWDNEKAGEKWRLQQASMLLRRIEVKVIKDGQPKIVRAFEIVSMPDNIQGIEGKFKSVSSSSSSSSRSKKLAIDDLNRVINRLEPFSEYKVVVSWLRKTAILLTSTEPKESTETKSEVKRVLATAV